MSTDINRNSKGSLGEFSSDLSNGTELPASDSSHAQQDGMRSDLPVSDGNRSVISIPKPTGTISGFKRSPLFAKEDSEYNDWDEGEFKRQKRVNPIARAIIYVAVGLISFLFFLYLTFPYGVVKEVAVGQIAEVLKGLGYPVRVSIGTLKPHWFTGIQLRDVRIVNSTDAAANISLSEITFRLNVLPLLWGTAKISGHVEQGQGAVDISASIPLFSLSKGLSSPADALLVFQKFDVDPFINHLLAVAKGSKDPAMVLILPLLSTTTLGGALQGSIQLDNPEVSHFSKAKGSVKLTIQKAYFHINDNTLKIPRQEFKEANIEMGFENNAVLVKGIKFSAPDIGIGLAGRVTLPEISGNPPQAELDLDLSMHGEIEKNLGFIVPNLMRCKALTNGELKAKLSGPLSSMTCL